MTVRRSPVSAITAFALLVATSAGLAGSLTPQSAVADATSASASPYGTELAQAAQTGTPVEVSSLTTETSQVMAQPDGEFRLTANSGPVRAMTSNGWAPIDTTLTANADGSFSPRVTTTPVRFSGGGNSLLVSLGTSSQGIDTSWPVPLPSPVVAGSTVTYPNVRPGVDLVMTAQPAGFTETLTVKNAAAAAGINSNPLVLTAVGKGVTVGQNADGSIVGTNSTGTAVFGSPVPTAWDSSVLGNDPNEHSTVTQAANALVATLGQITKQVTGGTQVTLTVPKALLTSSTVYPIYVDPNISSKPAAGYRTVQSGGWNYGGVGSSTSEPMRVGYCGWSGCTSVEGNARSYFDFDIAAIRRQQINSQQTIGATIYSASVSTREIWNAESSQTYVNLTQSGSFGSSTSYPGPFSSTLQSLPSNCGWNNANYCNLTFDNPNVVAYAQSGATNNWPTLTFALSAPAENDASLWKKFSSDNTLTTLSVTYNFPPGVPYGQTISNEIVCPNKTVYVNKTHPTITAKANSYNGPNSQVVLHYYAMGHPTSNPNLSISGQSVPVNGNPAAAAPWYPSLQEIPYSLREYSETNAPDTQNQQLDSAWTGYTDFTVDATPPAVPTVTSFSYPNSPSGAYWGTTSNQPGSFTLKSSADAAGFSYAFDGIAANIPANQCTYGPGGGMTGTVNAVGGLGTLTPNQGLFQTSGLHTLDVLAFDDAHNPTTHTTYKFYVSQDPGGQNVTFLEAEILPVALHGTTAGYIYNRSLATDSGGQDTELVTNTPGNPHSFDLTVKPASSGYYALGVQLVTGPHNGVATFQVNGQNVLDSQNNVVTQDTCTSSPGVPAQTVFVPLGGFQIDTSNPATYTVTITMSTSNCGSCTYQPTNADGSQNTLCPADSATAPGAPPAGYSDNGYTLGVDDIIASPISLLGGALPDAFNNHGIGLLGATTNLASLDLTTDRSVTPPNTGYNALDLNALSSVGFVQSTATQNNTLTITPPFGPNGPGPVTFTIPAAKNGFDNVISAGQTITMGNQTVGGNYNNPGFVDLLVASTCGAVPQMSSHLLGMTFTGTASPGGIDKPQPGLDLAIPDFTKTAITTNQTFLGNYLSPITTPYYLTSATSKKALDGSGAQLPATLYLLQVPVPQADYSYPLQSITLPTIGTDFTNTCSATNNALHVFAVATSPS